MKQRGICKLCLRQGELCESHVISEFLYEPLYDELHRAIEVTATPGERERYLQKGLREYLLCTECEGHLNRWETPATHVFRGAAGAAAPLSPGQHLRIPVDYRTIKLFELSILWRASVAEGPWFSKVSLGPHQETLRQRLLESDPGEPHEYGCLLIAMHGPNQLDQLLREPQRHRFEGHTVYSFLLAGLLWYFVVSAHSAKFPGQGSFLSANGLAIGVSSKTEHEILRAMGKKLLALGKL